MAVVFARLHDDGGILCAALQRNLCVSLQHGADGVVGGRAPLRPVVGIEARFAAVAAAQVAFAQVGAFAEVGHVFGQVSARFGDEGAKVALAQNGGGSVGTDAAAMCVTILTR